MKKDVRQAKIEQIINQTTVTTQDELMNKLNEVGIKVTQATLSRDIREMQIVKQPDSSGKTRYMIFKSGNQNEMERLSRMIYSSVTEVKQIEFVNVVHTLASYANPLTAVIDDLKMTNVAGTIAGYDTIVIFSPDKEAAQKVSEMFKQYANPDQLLDSVRPN
ncbi:ArgR family transcriptional regulator [Lentilactobacillus sp. Marseille-Q4993]|uniref:arginine repressor n=1 Tax=Lentilactobacillus sp. Marseille-Q4993 TaxID=3039492 RepID=UPI0024BCC355|nr:ArgR family transcriptional regulator [Lentilactobacillus sp. Marseille-Q4993]